jgi:ATP-dependent RNA circularization protein (DNA/RNA ligase family)
LSEFFRFPHTPHLAWLGGGRPRGDKVLSPTAAEELLRGVVIVEEKVDGANVGLSLSASGDILIQNRGSYLSRYHSHEQFGPLFAWVAERTRALSDLLAANLVLFGEWCYAVHSIRYDRLPDWFLAFDIFDRTAREFWSHARRVAAVSSMRIASVPLVGRGEYNLDSLVDLLGHSALRSEGPAEGLYVRRDSELWNTQRAKLVTPQFVQGIGGHWSKNVLQRNAILRQANSDA